jgi:uncharacterized membrane protein
MRCRDVALSVVLGIVLLALSIVVGTGFNNPVGQIVAQVAFGLWYVGVAALVAAVGLRFAKRWPTAAAVLGYVGIAWVTFVAAAIGLVLAIFVLNPPGY